MNHRPILLNEYHVTLMIDPTITDEGRQMLLKMSKREIHECMIICTMGMRQAIPLKDRNKFKFVTSQ